MIDADDPGGGDTADGDVDPTSLAGIWARFRGSPVRVQALGWIGVAFVSLLLLGAIAGTTGDQTVAIDEGSGVAAATPTPTPATSPTQTQAEADAARATPTATPDPTPDALPSTTAADGELEVHFIDVGQADVTLLLAPDATVLIDAGDWRRGDVVPYLRSQGVEAIDLIVITHPHADHIGQFDAVMDAFEVAEVWWSGASHTTRTYERAVAALERSDAAYEEPRAGDVTTVGSLRFEVVNPPPSADFSDLHDSGVSLRVTYGDVRFLFTGDAERQTEARMVRDHRGWLDADVYQVGHHGSSTSTTPAFLEAVSPSIAVYSAGEGNQYGHPHDEVIDRLDAAGIETYGTAVHGTVIVTTDGATWSVETVRSGSTAAARAPPAQEASEPSVPLGGRHAADQRDRRRPSPRHPRRGHRVRAVISPV